MAEITVVGSITRSELSLATLTIENRADASCPYSFSREGFGPGTVSWRRVTTQSPFVHGRFLLERVMDETQMNLSMRVRASSVDWVDYYLAQLIDAFSQFAYVLTFTIDGVYHQWLCETADFTVGNGGQFQDLNLRSYQQEVKFVVPRYPVPFGSASRY